MTMCFLCLKHRHINHNRNFMSWLLLKYTTEAANVSEMLTNVSIEKDLHAWFQYKRFWSIKYIAGWYLYFHRNGHSFITTCKVIQCNSLVWVHIYNYNIFIRQNPNKIILCIIKSSDDFARRSSTAD